MDRRSFFATLTAIGTISTISTIGVISALPKAKPKIPTKPSNAICRYDGTWNYDSTYFSKDEMHL